MAELDPSATQSNRPPDIEKELEGTGLDEPHVIGRGGFGVVYRCRQQALHRDVAVKILTSAEFDPDSGERFLREQQAMGALSGHPHIVHILQVGTTRSGRRYLMMPYHSAGSLETRIRNAGLLPLDEALRITIKLAGALETAHRAGILHRDVKPGNILLTDYGEPQLTDFGIARIEGGFETATGVVTGSPAFTAPEVLQSGHPSVASDVYGLGATLFCMLTGHAAYERHSGEQVVAQFLRIAAEPLPNLRPDGMPEDVCAAIEASMSHAPADRPSSAAEFGELLRDIQRAHDLPVEEITLPTAALPEIEARDPSEQAPAAPQPGGGGRSPAPWPAPTPPIAETKFRPTISARKLVDRGRLIDAHRTGLRRRLTVIHAPAGYGKTTLATRWAKDLYEQSEVTVAWLNVDQDDNNAAWFLTHVVEALTKARPELTAGLSRMLTEQGESATRRVLTTLINNVHQRRERVALFLDAWDRVTDPGAAAALRFLLENGCHHLQIVVTCRSTEGLPLATMRVRNELIETSFTTLRFDLAETRSLLVDLAGFPLRDEQIVALNTRTEGWAAALHLASLSLYEHQVPAALISHLSGRHHAIAEYLSENVLAAVNSELLDALLKTSVPDRISGDLAAALTGRKDGRALLEEIERKNLFLYRIDADGDWFRYHEMFAQFLRQRLDRDHPERSGELERTAATWFADHEIPGTAVDHAL